MIIPFIIWPLRRYGRIINPYTTYIVESSTSLWSINSLSWHTVHTERRIHVFGVISPLFLIPVGRGGMVGPSSPPRPVLGSHWRSCEVSTLDLDDCANCTSNLRFLSDEPFHVGPLREWDSIMGNPSTMYTDGHWRSCEVSTLDVERTVWIHVDFTFLCG